MLLHKTKVTSVAIKDPEKPNFLITEWSDRKMRVLHIDSPAYEDRHNGYRTCARQRTKIYQIFRCECV